METIQWGRAQWCRRKRQLQEQIGKIEGLESMPKWRAWFRIMDSLLTKTGCKVEYTGIDARWLVELVADKGESHFWSLLSSCWNKETSETENRY